MQFSQLARTLTPILLIVGAVSVMALVAFSGRPTTMTPSPLHHENAVALQDSTESWKRCDKFMHHGQDKSADVFDNANSWLRLYRTKGWNHDVAVLTAETTIGAAENKDEDESEDFPGLKSKFRGCVSFKVYDNTGLPGADAWFQLLNVDKQAKFSGALSCAHAMHDKEITPSWTSVPKKCSKLVATLQTSLRPITISWAAKKQLSGMTFISIPDIIGRIETTLAGLKLPKEEIAKFTTRVGAGGPWFPCALTGCCRVF